MADHIRKPKKTRTEKAEISLLKSAIQKAVRLNEPEKAVIATKRLFEIDTTAFLRRWLVINLEDGLLHPSFGKIATMLKENKVNEKDITLIIRSVYEVADCKYRDDWVDEHEEFSDNPEQDEARDFYKNNIFISLPKEEQEIIDGINHRANKGGMKGDLVMLKHFYRIWLKRFAKKEWDMDKLKGYFKESKIKFSEIKSPKKEDILLEAVDFHCSPLVKILLKKPSVLMLLDKMYKNKDPEQILKWVIWYGRSSKNLKLEIGSNQKRDWYKSSLVKERKMDKDKDDKIIKILEREISSIARWFLKKIYDNGNNL